MSPFLDGGSIALRVDNSVVSIADGSLQGGHGETGSTEWDHGGAGLYAIQSDVWLSGTATRGGDGGVYYGLGCSFSGCGDPGGPALRGTGSLIVFRGSATPIKGGWGLGDLDGHELFLTNSVAVLSGEAGGPHKILLQSSTLHEPAVDEPFLVIRGVDGLGNQRRLLLYGPPGETGLVYATFKPDFATFPMLEGVAWVDIATAYQVFALTTQGQGSPTPQLLPLPTAPGLVGFVMHFQAVFPGVSGALDPTAKLLTNPANVILR